MILLWNINQGLLLHAVLFVQLQVTIIFITTASSLSKNYHNRLTVWFLKCCTGSWVHCGFSKLLFRECKNLDWPKCLSKRMSGLVKQMQSKQFDVKLQQSSVTADSPWCGGIDGYLQLAVLSTIATPSPSFPSRGVCKNQVLPAETDVSKVQTPQEVICWDESAQDN